MLSDLIQLPAPGTGMLIGLDGRRTVITPAKPAKGFSFKELYPQLDCRTIELHELQDGPFKGSLLLFDEEGSFKGAGNVNIAASRLWRDAYPPAQYPHNNSGLLYGRVLLTHDNLVK